MVLLYKNKDITGYVSINKAEFTDNAGGIADSLELIFNDPNELWDSWVPVKNDTISIIENGLSTGTMYIDELEKRRGTFIIRALSIPQKAKDSNTQAWESIRFLEFATEIATRYGFSLETYGITNYLYDRDNRLVNVKYSRDTRNNVLEDNLIAYYSFDNNDASDLSGNNNTGIIHGSPTFVDDGKGGKSLYLNGTDQWIELTDFSVPEDFTISALIIMIKLNRATITVKAFFSVKYFFIFMELHEVQR
jgi:hypothetical protein